jgi:hypothetical protein
LYARDRLFDPPADLGNRLNGDHALRNPDPNSVRGLAVATVRDPQDSLVGRADGSLGIFERNMRMGCSVANAATATIMKGLCI